MSSPRVSVIIPAFNAQRTVGAAVASALDQTERDVEVIVVDDGSTDATAAAAAKANSARVRVIRQANRGLPAARNAGIAASRGQFVAFLDSDDLWLPDFVALLSEALAATDAGLAHTDAYAFDPARGRVRELTMGEEIGAPLPPPTDPQQFLLELLAGNFVYVSTMVPRHVLDRLGGFDESLPACEDYELWLRILLAGHRAAWVPGCHALYRVHPAQMSRQPLRMALGLQRVLDQLPPERLPSDAHREQLAVRRRWIAREVAILRGELRGRHGLRRTRWAAGAIRRRLGLAHRFYDDPPPEVAAAFPDLRAV